MYARPGIRRKWYSSELDFIEDNWMVMTNSELSRALQIPISSIRAFMYKKGIKRIELEYFTEVQVRFLTENYQSIGDVELAEIYNQLWPKNKVWTNKHIEKKRTYLGLKRTEAQKHAIRQRNVEAGRFSINHWKRWDGKVTPVGEVRVWRMDGYTYEVIKTENGFVNHARWLWEKHNGPIPEGYYVGFKNPNNRKVSIENLICISKHEHGLINRTAFLSYPEELKLVIMAYNKVKRKLKKVNNNGKKQTQ